MVLTARPSLKERLVGRVLGSGAGKTTQNRLGLRGSQAHGGRVLDHLVVLLLDQRPVNRARENQLEVRIGIRFSCLRAIEFLLVIVLEPGH